MDFVNREVEKRRLVELLSSNNRRKRCIFLVGPSGVGKSVLSTAAVHATSKQNLRIKVPHGADVKPSPGWLVREWAACLNALHVRNGTLDFQLATFANSLKSPIAKRAFHQQLIQASQKQPLGLILPVVNRFTGVDYSPEEIVSGKTESATFLCFDYILYAANFAKFTYIFENLHLADYESITMLRDILERRLEGDVLIELTANEGDHRLSELKCIFEQREVLQCEIQVVRPLEMRDYITIAKNYADLTDDDATAVYNSTEGNVRALEDFEITKRLGGTDKVPGASNQSTSTNPTDLNIRGLPKDCALVLSLISTHSTPCAIDLLHLAFSFVDEEFLGLAVDQKLKQLEDRKLLIFTDDKVALQHDDVSRSVDRTLAKGAFGLIATKCWYHAYRKLWDAQQFDFVSKIDVIACLLYFAGQYRPDSLLSFLTEIKQFAINALRKDTAKLHLERCEQALDRANIGGSSKFQLEIAKIYFSMGLYDESWRVLASIETEDKEDFSLLRLALLNRSDQFQECIVEAEASLAQPALSNDFRLGARILSIISLRECNKLDRARQLFEVSLAETKPTASPFRGILLRIADIFYPTEIAIGYVRQSVEFFRKRGDVVNEGHSRITLAMLLAKIHQLDEAVGELHISREHLLGDTLRERHYILNNLGAIELLRGNPVEAKEYLKDALLTAPEIYDRLNIAANLSIAYSLTEAEQSDWVLAMIDELSPQEIDADLLCNVYHSASILEEARNHPHRAATYLDGAKKMFAAMPGTPNSEIWLALLKGEEQSDVAKRYREIGYKPGFLAYWHFDL